MNLSLNEIEALCKKAARGAGMSWGLAEEAAKAARWLSAQGMEGPALLAAQLRLNDGTDYAQLAPRIEADRWSSAGRSMCPLIAGATLSDHAQLITGGSAIVLEAVSCPVLLAPFASRLASSRGEAVALSWPGCHLYFDAAGTMFCGPASDPSAGDVVAVTCEISPAQVNSSVVKGPAPAVAEAVLSYLTGLASRTYVPATEASRAQGAGSTLSDND
ncbi:MAG: DUF3726 domain-containing protein [Rhizobiaceae bacterium]|nr:DUF3726 domain-containing protein [Rhizobiaceae bacterium]MCP5238863.1 DUF3726 domain-containing protein [Zoogloeaceae bacterium]MCP5254249.1 DUF3726 domain-containing protein [Zoogloeaceae bacterium]MCW5617301.1 DUF3726 domain-containing protein [Rhodocyclaceae bacterium]